MHRLRELPEMWLGNRYFENKISTSKKAPGKKTNSALQSILGISYLATLGQWLRTCCSNPSYKGNTKNGFPLPPAQQSGEKCVGEAEIYEGYLSRDNFIMK